MGVRLKELTADTWRECIRLEVSGEQSRDFSTNLYQIPRSRFDPEFVLCSIHADEGEMVGFAIYAHQYTPKSMPPEPEGYWSTETGEWNGNEVVARLILEQR